MSHLSNILNPEAARTVSLDAPNPEEPPEPVNGHADQQQQQQQQPAPSSLPQARRPYAQFDHQPHPDCPDTLACLPDTDGRPQHTLPVILRCSILGSPRKRLTIREIYQVMEEKYPFYKTAGPTWKQSVRHHLSLNRLFERQPRPVTDPGFGSYWTVNLSAPPGTKRPRKRGRNNKEKDSAASSGQAISPTDVPVQLFASTSSYTLSHQNGYLPTPTSRRRGRPRKGSGDSPTLRGETPMSSQAGEDGDGIMTPLDGPPESDDGYDSREEEPTSAISPFDRRDPMGGPLGPPSFSHHTRSSMSLPLPSIHNPDLEVTQATIERLREEVGTLRRQSAEAVSVSLRLSEQLAQAQREIERSRNEIRDLEEALEDEQQRRADAENLVNLERARNRPIVLHPGEMPQMVQIPAAPQPPRSPQQARGPM